MGLIVHDLGKIPHQAESREFFIYILDYGWQDSISDALRRNFDAMVRMTDETNSVVIKGVDSHHFSDSVFSWHQINGEEGEKMLPAILITTLLPSYFNDRETYRPSEQPNDDLLLLIPLRDVCSNGDDVVRLIDTIFKDMKAGKGLANFEVAKKIKRNHTSKLFDALILQPNISGIGIDLKKLL